MIYHSLKDNHLKATRICQQCSRPVHEVVKTPQLINKFRSRTERQMICIPQYYLAANLLKLISCQPFDSPCNQENLSYVIKSYIKQKWMTISACMHAMSSYACIIVYYNNNNQALVPKVLGRLLTRLVKVSHMSNVLQKNNTQCPMLAYHSSIELNVNRQVFLFYLT